MIALITGASSGIGEEFAKILAKKGFNLILVARRKGRLSDLRRELMSNYNIKVRALTADLSDEEECIRLYETVKKLKIDILINNAGFGLFGKFTETNLHRELEMIDLNIKAVHILTKLFVRDFAQRNYGFILNVSSIAGFMAGPLMATYYASKNYVTQLTRAIGKELKKDKKNVYVGVLCPGPVKTEFNKVAGSEFAVSGITAAEAAQYAVSEMFKGNTVIIPSNSAKTLAAMSKFAPSKLMLTAAYFAQTARRGDPSDSKPLLLNSDNNSEKKTDE
ncbi:MAG: SDR family oxidoreductase [Firmicutes bacterium]|nr:SDR family oxidoreductase [[Eubacterium] siraeum]MCM1487118.1 SDR family oxidoreductase [Bacillota bacterium]